MPRNVSSTGSGPELKLSLAMGAVFVGLVDINADQRAGASCFSPGVRIQLSEVIVATSIT